MFTVRINGRLCQSDKDKTLLRFLRDDLKLMGTKDGCSEGACGACTVLIDGKKARACVQKLSRLEGREVTTIEGLSERERSVYSHCFAEAGAVQCGFCTPGMVLSAKALLDANPSPTPQEVREALRGNICRCTGYAKIEEAILMAATFFRTGRTPALDASDGRIGAKIKRLDAVAKTLGTAVYTDDINLKDMVHCRILRAPAPRCLIKKIDISEALRNPRCAGIVLAKDVPYNKHGHIIPDWDVLVAEGQTTRYIGDALAIVASDTLEGAGEVLSQIRVSYEELPPLLSLAEALSPGAPLVHPEREGGEGNLLATVRLRRGNPEEALGRSAHVVHRVFHTPATEHAFMETECAVATCSPEGEVTVFTSSQSVFDERREISRMLALPPEKVRCVSCYVGGGFGGKEDMSVQHHAALAAWVLRRPAKVRLSRQESINVHPKRHPMDLDFTLGCDEAGRITALKASILTDNGAYASLGQPVLERACTHAGGPYHYHDIEVVGRAVYTNNVPCGAFRGFGVPQSCFALESCLDIMAREIGMDPFQIRMENAIRPGEELPNGQIAGRDTALVQCLEAVRPAYEADPLAGIACSFKNTGLGVGIEDAGRCRIKVENGKAAVYCSAACMGQGFATVALMVAVETTGLRPEDFVISGPDTLLTPDCGTSTASRQSAISGEAVRLASLKLRKALEGHRLSDLEGEEFYDEFHVRTDPVGSPKPHPVSHLAYSYSVQVASLGADGKVERMTAAFDSGTVINPVAIEGQAEGGIAMGMGYALTEDFPVENGIPKARYGTLGLLRSTDVPKIVPIFVHSPERLDTSYGAKGIGELTTIGAAPAIWGAYYRKDGRERDSLPLAGTPYRK